MAKEKIKESRYEKAAALWVKRHFQLKDSDVVTDVTFANYVGGYCETCGYETLGLDFMLNGKYTNRELGYYNVTPGQFIEECVALLDEV